MVRSMGSRTVADAPRPWQMLVLTTIGFALCFWAWALLAPVGPQLRDDLALSSFEQSLVVAVPVVVGALGRIARHERAHNSRRKSCSSRLGNSLAAPREGRLPWPVAPSPAVPAAAGHWNSPTHRAPVLRLHPDRAARRPHPRMPGSRMVAGEQDEAGDAKGAQLLDDGGGSGTDGVGHSEHADQVLVVGETDDGLLKFDAHAGRTGSARGVRRPGRRALRAAAADRPPRCRGRPGAAVSSWQRATSLPGHPLPDRFRRPGGGSSTPPARRGTGPLDARLLLLVLGDRPRLAGIRRGRRCPAGARAGLVERAISVWLLFHEPAPRSSGWALGLPRSGEPPSASPTR